jgi:hypothetical protein
MDGDEPTLLEIADSGVVGREAQRITLPLFSRFVFIALTSLQARSVGWLSLSSVPVCRVRSRLSDLHGLDWRTFLFSIGFFSLLVGRFPGTILPLLIPHRRR